MSLAHRSISAARWTTVSNITRAGLQLAQLIVLTRFLSPQDYGLMAMVTVVVSYAALFSDMGLSTAFVQRQHVSQEERSSLYWLNVAVGAGLMLLVMAASPLAAYLLDEPLLPGLITLVSTNFLVVALGQQLRIDAEKALNFRPVAVIEVISAVIGFAVAVTAAWLGWGVHALVLAAMSSAWITMLLAWTILARGWRPLWRFRWTEVSWFVHFGGGMVANNVINHINTTVDVLIGGRLLGAAQLGLYSVPRNLILQIQFLVNPIFTRVGFPVIASIQNDNDRVRRVYLKIMNFTASVNAPIYVATAVFAPEFVQLLFGNEFHDAVPLLRVLAAWGLFRSFSNPIGSLVFGLGRVRLSTLWNLALLFIIPPALWFGSNYGAEGMAWTMTGMIMTLFVPSWAILVKPTCNATLWAYSRQVLIPTLCAVLAGGAAWLSVSIFNQPWLRLGSGLTVGVILYAVLIWLLNRELLELGAEIINQRTSR
ncbi:colanic acid exporter [Thauera sp. 27]|uniref:MOP flippase family protein n=1 Tax=Thauera sp. 27 TaxID=305700 RepID=UPI0002CFA135|nr:MOP flippase family protein [Thauera sp. 27]ENO77390.1 colanic acid exporter [Thauera sp. 27]